jgi:DNA modification methylase
VIIQGDSLHELKELDDNSIDFVCTDPPYGYSFMGKDWDKAVPSVEIWQECLRVLKPGAFMCVMSAPRSDVQNAMISRLMEAGFRLDFTPIYWTYASGFPKAGNIGKLVDKRLGQREVVETIPDRWNGKANSLEWAERENKGSVERTRPSSDQAKALDGSYAGFQPKPAVEVIIVAMKPLSEKTYVDQALANGHGVSWLDDGRIPTGDSFSTTRSNKRQNYGEYKSEEIMQAPQHEAGRFPANLLVSDDVLNDGVERKSPGAYIQQTKVHGEVYQLGSLNNKHGKLSTHHGDSGSYSRYFDLDKWSQTLPFLITPKASKSEKNKGLEHFTPTKTNDGRAKEIDNAFQRGSTLRNNHHPTVKPLKLMSYLITLFSRPGDTVLDPFVGSGTTVVAAKQLDRHGIGIEREAEYAEIARARLAHIMPQLPPELPEPAQPPVLLSQEIEQLRLV